MSIKSSSTRSLLIFLGDIIIVPFSYVAGYWIRFGNISGFREEFPLLFLLIMLLSYLTIFYFLDLYALKIGYIAINSLIKIFFGVLVGSIFISFLKYVIYLSPIRRAPLIIATLIMPFMAFIWRGLCYQLFKYLIKPKRLIIAGAGKTGQEIAQIIKSGGADYEIVGFVEDDKDIIKEFTSGEKIKILGPSDKLLTFAEKHRINQIVLTYSEQENPQLTKNVLRARLKGIEVIGMPDMYQTIKQRIPIDHVKENWFLKEKGFERSNNIFILKVKRLLDIILSSLILLMSLPLWPIIAMLIKINSRGPVFYFQQRVGKNESFFNLYKFRSMIDKAEEDKAVWADENDIRITLVGKILRKLHVDELPQFWNVIRGEMSLVGSRPERPKFVEELEQNIPYYSLRHLMKPGITGWAQINYPYASSLKDSHEKLEYDLYYISHMSLLFDFQILMRTARIIILGKQRKRSRDLG